MSVKLKIKQNLNIFPLNIKNGVIITAVFSGVFLFIAQNYLNYLESFAISVLYSVLFFLTVFGVVFAKLVPTKQTLFFVLIVSFFVLFIRLMGADIISPDFVNAFYKWVENFRETGVDGFTNLATVNNYSFPYLYLCYFMSLVPIETIALVKFVSILFDIGCAFYAAKITSVFTTDNKKQLAVYFGVLLLPTVVLNSAWWAQCDSIYTMFCLAALYFAMKDKMYLVAIFGAVAFSFKLQAAFVLPFMAILLFVGKFKIKHCLMFAATYVGVSVPAFLVGAPFSSLFTVYLNQASEIASLNRNSASIFAFVPYGAAKGLNPNDSELFVWEYAQFAETLGFVITFLFVIALIVIGVRKRKQLSNKTLLILTFLFSTGIPFLLPYMHDRYFFPGEILAVILAVCFSRFAATPLLLQFAAFTPYNIYLILGMPLVPLELCAIAVAISLILAGAELFLAKNFK